MEQKNRSIRDEIHEIINVQESDTPDDGWLSTNESAETVSDFEMFAEQLNRITDDRHRWKWAIVALHSGLQGLMVLALKGSNGLNVLHKDDKTRWLEWYHGDQSDKTRPRNLKLASVLQLYRRIKRCKMRIYCGSRMFIPTETQDQSVGKLNALRNKFIHFTPKVWGLELAGLPAIASECLEIAEFLAWKSGNVMWHKPDMRDRLETAFQSAHKSLCTLRKKGLQDDDTNAPA